MIKSMRLHGLTGVFFLSVFLSAICSTVAIAGVEDENNASEKDGSLKVKFKLFGGTKYSLSGSEEESVFGFWGGVRSEYKDIVSSNEEALQLANSAGTFKKLGNLVGSGLMIYGFVDELENIGNNDYELIDTSYLLAGIGVFLVSEVIGYTKIKKSAATYNEGVLGRDTEVSYLSKVPIMPIMSPHLKIRGTTVAQVQVFAW
jgi:hypothetical protein